MVSLTHDIGAIHRRRFHWAGRDLVLSHGTNRETLDTQWRACRKAGMRNCSLWSTSELVKSICELTAYGLRWISSLVKLICELTALRSEMNQQLGEVNLRIDGLRSEMNQQIGEAADWACGLRWISNWRFAFWDESARRKSAIWDESADWRLTVWDESTVIRYGRFDTTTQPEPYRTLSIPSTQRISRTMSPWTFPPRPLPPFLLFWVNGFNPENSDSVNLAV